MTPEDYIKDKTVEYIKVEDVQVAVNLARKKYYLLIGYLNALSHSVLTMEEHELLDKIMDFIGEDEAVYVFASCMFDDFLQHTDTGDEKLTLSSI